MNHFRTVLAFSWAYLRRYWVRLLLGVLLGVVFGLSNATFVWATGALTERLKGDALPNRASDAPAAAGPGGFRDMEKQVKGFLTDLDQAIKSALDPWLPLTGRAPDWRQYLGGLLFLPALVSFRSVSGYLSSYCMGWVSEKVINDLRVDVLAKLSTLSIDFFNKASTGDLLTRVVSDTAALQRTLRVGFADLVKESITILSIFVALCLIDWKLTLFSMVFLPLCLAPLYILGKRARKASAASVKASVSQSSQLVEIFSGFRVIKAFELEKEQLDRFRRLSRELVRQGMKGVKAKELVNPIIEVVSTGAIGVLIVYLFATRASIEDLVSFLTGLLIFYSPVKRLGAIHIMLEQTSVGVFRLIHILNEKPTVLEPVHPKPLNRFSTAIEFDSVSFAYAQTPVLREINLKIPRGFRLGIAGASGSGKSSLVNLLLRFYDPTEGSIRMDGIDLREMSTHDLRSLVALVSQEVVLFDQTVAENIACGKRNASADEIADAARAAFAFDFIQQLPRGLDTRIGERGVTLSGGQRQRLAIARAFIRDAPILILDEATAALDAEAEAEVQAAIERLEENRTVICVAHRLATLKNMDEIAVLNQGRVIERGSFNSLLVQGGAFTEMARRQGFLPRPSSNLPKDKHK